jgi:hypothetical protein
VLLGVVGFTRGIGSGVGPEAMPGVFKPMLRAVLMELSFALRTDFHYGPSERTLVAIMLATEHQAVGRTLPLHRRQAAVD